MKSHHTCKTCKHGSKRNGHILCLKIRWHEISDPFYPEDDFYCKWHSNNDMDLYLDVEFVPTNSIQDVILDLENELKNREV